MMAAGLGFKTFTTGEVLTAGDVNGYLMQGINVFATTTARNAAITAPAEGQFAFTKDTNSLWYYDGAAWVASGATGDIEGITVTSPITGGGTSGTVNIAFDTTAANTLTLNAQTGTTYTLVIADAANKIVELNNASAITVTVPPSVYSIGQQVNAYQRGAGQVTFSQGAGVTIRSTGGTSTAPKLRAQYSAATVICIGVNEFLIVGDLS
jgi:hypothetical protein